VLVGSCLGLSMCKYCCARLMAVCGSSSIPEPPAPGGNCRIPSFVEDDKALNKGVVFGHKLKVRLCIVFVLGQGRVRAHDVLIVVPSTAVSRGKKSRRHVVFPPPQRLAATVEYRASCTRTQLRTKESSLGTN